MDDKCNASNTGIMETTDRNLDKVIGKPYLAE